MIANYHTHTYRCRHAKGTDEEYVLKAIKEGLEVIGFSDHTPQPYENNYVSPAKMTIEEMDGYFSSILSLKEKYKDYINIHIGFETEYYPALFDKLLSKYENYPVEYIILGQHWVGNESIDKDSFSSFTLATNDLLEKYVSQVIEGLNTNCFSYLCHPDILNLKNPDDDYYCEQMGKIIKCAKEKNIPLELNLLGIHEKRRYPNPLFWEMVSKSNAKVILGCDAHNPNRVADKEELKEAYNIVDKLGLNLIEKLDMIKPTK